MLPNTKALLAFAGRFLLIFFLILPLWFVVTPTYNRLLASSATIVLSFTENPPLPTLSGWGNDILLMRDDPLSKDGRKVQGFRGNLTHFNVILMVALVFASRHIDWRSRCKVLAVALGILFIAHVAYLVIGVKFFQQSELEAFQGPGGRLSVWGVNFYLSIASQLLPVVIWMALYRWVAKEPAFDVEKAAGGARGEKQRLEHVGHERGKM